jgi:vitamin B12 transporter
MPPLSSLAFAVLAAVPTLAAAQSPTTELPGIVVTATRSPEPIANLIADVTAIDGDPTRRAHSVSQLLRFAGGVQSTASGGPAATSGVLIRGGNAGHTLTLIEGFRVSSASLGQTTFESLPLRHAGRMEVLRGPASALYGADALAGVVQLFAPTAAPGLRFTGEAAFGGESTRQLAAGVAGGSETLTGGVTISRDRSAGFNATTPDNFAFNPDRDGYRRDGVSAHFDAKLAGGTRLRGIALQNRLESEYDDGAFANARVDSRTELIGLTGTHEVDAITEVAFRIGQSVDKSDNRSSFPGTFRSRLLQYGLSGTRRLNEAARVQLLLERLEEKVASSSYDSSAADKRTTNSIGLVFLGDEGPHLLQASVRLDDSDQFDAQTNYAIAYGYRLGGGLRAGGSYATGFHAPGFNDLYFPNYGRSTIRPERSRSAELGLYWNPPPDTGWHGKAVVFQSRVRDLINFAAVCPDPDPRYVFGCADNVDRARIKGLSLGLGRHRAQDGSRPAAGLSWYLNLDFLDPRNQTTGTRLARRATRQLSAGAEYGVGDLSFGIDLLAANRRFDDAANLDELGGYAVFNLRAAYQLAPEWQAFATVDNAGDRAYATALDYAQQGRLVMLGVRYRTR